MYTTKLAHMIAHSSGVGIVYDAETPHADLSTRTIHLPPHFQYFVDDAELLSIILEECGHIRYTQNIPQEIFKAVVDKHGKLGSDIFDCLNVLEDIRIRNIMCQKYKGASQFFHDHLDSMKSFGELEPHVKLGITYNYDQFNIESPWAVSRQNGWTNACTPATMDLFDSAIFKELVDLIPKKEGEDKSQAMQDIKQAIGEAMAGMKEDQEAREADMKDNDKKIDKDTNEALKHTKGGKDAAVYKGELRFEVSNHLISQLKKPLDQLKEMNISRTIENQTRGKLNGRKLYKVASGSNKIFKRTIMPDKKGDVALAIMVDLSGSMYPGPAGIALGCAFMMAKGLEALNKKCMIMGYSTENLILKDFSERAVHNTIKNRADSIANGGTEELPALMKVKEALEKNCSKRKMILTITDGEPSDYEKTAAYVASMPYDKMAIGIQESVKYYPTTKTIHDASELPAALSEMFNKIL